MLRLHVFFLETRNVCTGAHENELIAVYLIGENEPVLNTISLTIRRKNIHEKCVMYKSETELSTYVQSENGVRLAEVTDIWDQICNFYFCFTSLLKDMEKVNKFFIIVWHGYEHDSCVFNKLFSFKQICNHSIIRE